VLLPNKASYTKMLKKENVPLRESTTGKLSTFLFPKTRHRSFEYQYKGRLKKIQNMFILEREPEKLQIFLFRKSGTQVSENLHTKVVYTNSAT
jgi:hypothetical protein